VGLRIGSCTCSGFQSSFNDVVWVALVGLGVESVGADLDYSLRKVLCLVSNERLSIWLGGVRLRDGVTVCWAVGGFVTFFLRGRAVFDRVSLR
jgi:hypothetical protein